MPRPTLFTHPKFHRLAFTLGVPEPHALGYLEFLWAVAYASGDPIIGDEVDVEIMAKWPGGKGKLVAALLSCRFIDRLDDGRYGIHDIYDHAPDYVRKRQARESDRRTADKGGQRPVTDRSMSTADHSAVVNGRPPTPTPTPTLTPAQPAAPEVINVAMVGDARGRGKRGNKMLTPPEFVRFWSAYPRKVAKAAAERCWRGINPDSALVAQIMSALEAHKKTPQWVDPVYVPHPATWLNQKRWEDELRPGGPRSLTDFDIAHGTYYPEGGPDGTGLVKETHHCSRETCTRCIEEKANGIVKPVQDLRGQYDY